METTPQKTAQATKPLKIRKTNKTDSLFSRLLDDNRLIFVCSVLLAFVLWCLVSAYASPEIERTISNVPVSVQLSDTPRQLGLQIFGDTEYFVDVTVRGPKYQLSENMFTPDNIKVTANTSYVNSAGESSLNLRAEIADTSSNVDIVSISRSSVSVYFDTLKETVFTLEPDVRFPDGVEPVNEGYILDTPILSVSSVTVSGPTTEVNKIKRVVARVENGMSLTNTTTSPAQIFMLGENNTNPVYCTCSADDLTVTMPVKKIVTLPVRVGFTNAPISYLSTPLAQSVSPETVSVALSSDIADTMEFFEVGTVDFSELDNTENYFTFYTADISDVKFIDPVPESFTVCIDASSMQKNEYPVTLSAVTTANLPEEFLVTYDLSKAFNVSVIGPEASFANLSSSGIYAEVDYAGMDISEGRQTVNASFYVKSLTDCWCMGKYRIRADITRVAAATDPANTEE